MPCDGSYMDPTQLESNRKNVCQFIVWLHEKLDEPVPDEVRSAADHIYGEGVDIDQVTAQLCRTIRKMRKSQRDDIIYNGRDRFARKLADWWDDHVEADKARSKKEREEKSRAKIAEKAMSKLTRREKDALNLKGK